MKKIVIIARPYDEHTSDLVHLLGVLFPECEVQVTFPEAKVPMDRDLSHGSPVNVDCRILPYARKA